MGVTCLEMDPCLFIKNNCIVVLCVDDAIIVSKDNAEIEQTTLILSVLMQLMLALVIA